MSSPEMNKNEKKTEEEKDHFDWEKIEILGKLGSGNIYFKF